MTAKLLDQETWTVKVTVSPGATLGLSGTACAESRASTLTVWLPVTEYAGYVGPGDWPQEYGKTLLRPTYSVPGYWVNTVTVLAPRSDGGSVTVLPVDVILVSSPHAPPDGKPTGPTDESPPGNAGGLCPWLQPTKSWFTVNESVPVAVILTSPSGDVDPG